MPRPEKPIDWERVDELLECGCLGNEIAAHYNMHPNTFYDRVVSKYNMSFTDYQAEKKYKGDSLIREAQFKKALKKLDNTMLIWLGKQRLGQKENLDSNQESPLISKAFDAVIGQLNALQASAKPSSLSNNETTQS